MPDGAGDPEKKPGKNNEGAKGMMSRAALCSRFPEFNFNPPILTTTSRSVFFLEQPDVPEQKHHR
jgi:hypothetical protein